MQALRTRSRCVVTIAGVLSAGTIACGGAGDATEPPVPQTPSRLEAATPATQSAAVASAVPVTVVVRSAQGAGVAGVSVTFAVAASRGFVFPPSVVTDASGKATAQWTLDSIAGRNDLQATVTGLSPLAFSATGLAGPAAALQMVSGNKQLGAAGSRLELPLTVRATDRYANPVSGVAVSFTASGGGTIQGSTTLSDPNGIAASGSWTLGSTGDAQSVTATAGAFSVRFVAYFAACPLTVLALNQSISGTLEAGDCQVAGAPTDQYKLNTLDTTLVALTLTSSAFAAKLGVLDPTGVPIASADQIVTAAKYCDFFQSDGCHTPTTSTIASPMLVLTAAAARLVSVSSGDQRSRPYTLDARKSTSGISLCATTFVERGLTTTQQLEPTDCLVKYNNGPTYYSDDVKLYIAAGATVHIKMSSLDFTPWVDVFDSGGVSVGGCAKPVAVDCAFTPSAAGYYLIGLSAFEAQRSGKYTLVIE